jgi:hypothetical protein
MGVRGAVPVPRTHQYHVQRKGAVAGYVAIGAKAKPPTFLAPPEQRPWCSRLRSQGSSRGPDQALLMLLLTRVGHSTVQILDHARHRPSHRCIL